MKADINVSKDRISKAHKRVVEKVKEIPQNYSKAVASVLAVVSQSFLAVHVIIFLQITPN